MGGKSLRSSWDAGEIVKTLKKKIKEEEKSAEELEADEVE